MARQMTLWSHAEDYALTKAWSERGTACVPDVARQVGRSVDAVFNRAQRIGLRQTYRQRRPKWNEAEIQTLVAMWDQSRTAKDNARAIGLALDRPIDGVLYQAETCGFYGFGHDDDPTDGAERHAQACMAEGGFPAAVLTSQGTVWVYPKQQVAA